MNDAVNERRKALEEEYFQKQNQKALERISNREEVRKSPITGEPMEQVTIGGVVIDKCPTSNGIWLDAGELEQILEESRKEEAGHNYISNFFLELLGKR